jgi:hypothetical protein
MVSITEETDGIHFTYLQPIDDPLQDSGAEEIRQDEATCRKRISPGFCLEYCKRRGTRRFGRVPKLGYSIYNQNRGCSHCMSLSRTAELSA